jgi:hypothetical protein
MQGSYFRIFGLDRSRDSVVSKAFRLSAGQLDVFCSVPGGYKNLISTPKRADRLCSPFNALSPGIKPSVCESDDSYLSNAKVTNGYHLLPLPNNS